MRNENSELIAQVEKGIITKQFQWAINFNPFNHSICYTASFYNGEVELSRIRNGDNWDYEIRFSNTEVTDVLDNAEIAEELFDLVLQNDEDTKEQLKKPPRKNPFK